MHVLVIPSEQYVPLHAPLAGIFQYHQVQLLASAGHQVGVVSIRLEFTIPMIIKGLLYKSIGKKVNNACDSYSFIGLMRLFKQKISNPELFITEELKDGIPVINAEGFYFYSTSDRHSLIGWKKAGMAAVDTYIKRFGKPDLVHAHNALNAGILAESIHRKYGLPYIITEHSSRWARNEISDKVLIRQTALAFKNSKANFAVSSDFGNKLNSLFKNVSVQVLPNVIDPSLEARVFEGNRDLKPEFVFLHIAELKPVKDQATIIRAFKKVAHQFEDAVLCIGGSGELADELGILVKELGLGAKVRFLGHLKREDVYRHINNCDCFVMCSLYETFCVVLIEALLFGKPVVSGNSGGPSDIVDEQVGVLVQTRNPELLADGMMHVYRNRDKYNREAIRNYVINKYGSKQFVNTVNKIYKEVVNE